MIESNFDTRRAAALALLNTNDPPLSKKAGQFCGQIAVDAVALSPAQADWFGKLLDRAGLSLKQEDAQ